MSSMISDMDLATTQLILPELLMLGGILAMILVPNFGNATMRIPLTSIQIPILFGGTRFATTNNPKLPNQIATTTLALAFMTSLLFLSEAG